MRQQSVYAKQAAVPQISPASQASAAETVALTLVVSIALTSVAIGAWSMLALFNNLSGHGVEAVPLEVLFML